MYSVCVYVRACVCCRERSKGPLVTSLVGIGTSGGPAAPLVNMLLLSGPSTTHTQVPHAHTYTGSCRCIWTKAKSGACTYVRTNTHSAILPWLSSSHTFKVNPHPVRLHRPETVVTLERGINRRPITLNSNYVQFAPDALQSRIKPALLLVENVMLLARWTLSTPTSVLDVDLHGFMLAHSHIHPVID